MVSNLQRKIHTACHIVIPGMVSWILDTGRWLDWPWIFMNEIIRERPYSTHSLQPQTRFPWLHRRSWRCWSPLLNLRWFHIIFSCIILYHFCFICCLSCLFNIWFIWCTNEPDWTRPWIGGPRFWIQNMLHNVNLVHLSVRAASSLSQKLKRRSRWREAQREEEAAWCSMCLGSFRRRRRIQGDRTILPLIL